jgi:glucokinase
MNTHAIGIDIGGTKIDAAVVGEAGNIIVRKKIPTQVALGFKQIHQDITNLVVELKREAGVEECPIGVGMAGQITRDTGVVKFAPNLKWRDAPLQEQLQATLRAPVIIINDVRAATWGEWKYGAGKGYDDLICLFIGTGIGGGIVSGGQLLLGANNAAGELGHTTVAIDGPECTCGNKGCLEAIASGWAIAKAGQALPMLEGMQPGKISARDVLEAARNGNGLAEEIIENSIEAIEAGCVSFVNALNPGCLILGGGLGLALPHLVERVTVAVSHEALKAASEHLNICMASLQNDAGVIGAAGYALNKLR